MPKIRYVSLLLNVAFCGLLRPAAAFSQSPEELIVWAMGEEGKKIAVMAQRFEQENPGVKVVTQPIPWDAA
ncbi:MAG TPA: hypothetical protein PK876_08465, partial [Elusimicrobiota bacterium]|nr:hypothetical protein [Elusimicrobiota bacterium]